jgi:ABC-2 type transport system permease protein
VKFNGFSLSRWTGIVVKEFIQMKRDRLTFGMIIGIPIIQLTLFGFAINSDPKHLPTAVLSMDNSMYSRALIGALQNSEYFHFTAQLNSPAQGESLLARGDVHFVITIPEDFERKLTRGERPEMLVEADATDPVATANALTALQHIVSDVLDRELNGVLQDLKTSDPPFELRIHRLYNPEGVTAYNIVPGLMGVILTMTMVLMTGLAMTRERERGTFENLLSTPALPVEVMTGKIVPFILIGLIQVSLVLLAGRYIFEVPMEGSLLVLYGVVFVFIAANLTLGITFSAIARNQLQAMQMTFFFFLPSILLSGFMFPFRGMPEWAQVIGNVLPLTHFLLLVRGILLKGITVYEVWPQVWPILTFMVAVLIIGLRVYRRTLD